jgi:hypothetical protein
VRPRAGHAAEERLELRLHIGPVQRAVGLQRGPRSSRNCPKT